MAGPFETSILTERRTREHETIGSWQDAKVEDIEDYLLGTQRKFIKYKLNIFYLNRVSTVEQNFTSANFSLLSKVCAQNPTLLLQQEKREAGQGNQRNPLDGAEQE